VVADDTHDNVYILATNVKVISSRLDLDFIDGETRDRKHVHNRKAQCRHFSYFSAVEDCYTKRGDEDGLSSRTSHVS
jgi:hypothetical protein